MSIQEYARSPAATAGGDVGDRRVSKDQVFRFVERQFLLADADRDGSLTAAELTHFLELIAHPARDTHGS